jgi:hypothetical protein
MNDVNDFLDVAGDVPRWKQDAKRLGIQTFYVFDMADSYWEASIEIFGHVETQCGETEREAVISLMFKLKLD